MRTLFTSELVDAWEAGLTQSLLYKSLHLLSLVTPASGIREVAEYSIGARDASLLLLRESLFGSRLISITQCPACAQTIEWEVDVQDLLTPSSAIPSDDGTFSFTFDGFVIQYRLPNSIDVANTSTSQPDLASANLLAGCILKIQHEQEESKVSDLPEHVLNGLSQSMSEADPQADIAMDIHCPDCGHQWQVPFDIMSYLWTEIDGHVRHLLEEVYILARAFSWSETDILHMSSYRRKLYLQMLYS